MKLVTVFIQSTLFIFLLQKLTNFVSYYFLLMRSIDGNVNSILAEKYIFFHRVNTAVDLNARLISQYYHNLALYENSRVDYLYIMKNTFM